MLKDLKERTAIDRKNNIYSMVIQDERYFNYYMWKHGNRSDIDMRILGPSYLFPFNPHGFGEHVTKKARPIIIHGTAKPGKMVKGEAELKIEPVGELEGKNGQCFDVAVLKDLIGTYQCHDQEHRGGSQGFIWTDDRLRVAWVHTTNLNCNLISSLHNSVGLMSWSESFVTLGVLVYSYIANHLPRILLF